MSTQAVRTKNWLLKEMMGNPSMRYEYIKLNYKILAGIIPREVELILFFK